MEINKHDEVNCETCILAKQLNIKNKSNVIKVNNPLDVVYSDLAGPIDPIGKDGFKYVINFVDEYSGCTFCYCLKQKYDAVKATEKFISDVAPYGKIKVIRTDNGGEFISDDFNSLLIKNKIKHNYTCPYSPHQNGTAERSWRTLFDMARALLIESKLPKFLWPYAINTAVYIRNKCFFSTYQRYTFSPYY